MRMHSAINDLSHSHYSQKVGREPEHAILANLLSPHSYIFLFFLFSVLLEEDSRPGTIEKGSMGNKNSKISCEPNRFCGNPTEVEPLNLHMNGHKS